MLATLAQMRARCETWSSRGNQGLALGETEGQHLDIRFLDMIWNLKTFEPSQPPLSTPRLACGVDTGDETTVKEFHKLLSIPVQMPRQSKTRRVETQVPIQSKPSEPMRYAATANQNRAVCPLPLASSKIKLHYSI